MPGRITPTRPSSLRNWNSSEMEDQETKAEQTAPPEVTQPAAAAPATEAPRAQLAPMAQPAKPNKDPGGHIWGTGRRKSSVARVRIRPGSGKILINKREVNDYFPADSDRQSVVAPLETAKMLAAWDIWVNVGGGGMTGQAGAVEMGLARALAKAMPELEQDLRDQGLMTRDSRMKERKKYGQRGARRRFQFSKR